LQSHIKLFLYIAILFGYISFSTINLYALGVRSINASRSSRSLEAASKDLVSLSTSARMISKQGFPDFGTPFLCSSRI
jgi:purine-cytosine permease-like protein